MASIKPALIHAGILAFGLCLGAAIHTPPNTPHRMINTGPGRLELLYVWWAPGGDRGVLDVASTMLEGWDRPPIDRRSPDR